MSSESTSKNSEKNTNQAKVLKVKTPKKVVIKDLELSGTKKRDFKAFPELNANVIRAEKLAKIEKIKQILAKDGISGYLKTHSVEEVILGLSNEVSFIKDMIRA